MLSFRPPRTPCRSQRPTRPVAALAGAAVAGAWLVLAANAAAQPPPPDLQPVPEPPPIPDRVESGQALEPDVRISRRDQATVTEYLVNGRLRAIKVQPDGDLPAYYLYDTDGDGSLDRRDSRFDPDLLIPNWVIFSW